MEQRAKLRDRLREAMNLRGIRAVDLVDKTGIPKGAISYYLSGRSTPKSDRIYELSKALDINEAWLLGFDVPMARSEESKKNDHLSKMVVRLRTDNDFYNLVTAIDSLNESQYQAIKNLVATLK